MEITSPWTINWDPDGTDLELCAIGQGLDDSIRFPFRQSIKTVKEIEGAVTQHYARLQWDGTVTLEIYKQHASVAAALLWIPAHHLEVRTITRADLQFLSDDGASGTNELRLTNAVLESVDPRPAFTRADPTRTVTTYNFKGSDFLDPAA